MLNRVKKRLSLDKALIYTILGYIVSAGAMPVSAWLILNRFTGEEQGYYYTFISVLTLQVFFELGITQCIVQFSSHEFAYLKISEGGSLEGPENHQKRFVAIVHFAIKLYAAIFVLAFVGMGLGGYWFFKTSHTESVDWLCPWWALCAASSLSLFLNAFSSILEGTGNIGWIAQIRMVANITRIVILSIAIISGYKLMAPVMATFGASLVLGIAIWIKWGGFFKKAWGTEYVSGALSWRREIWPYQWRIAVSFVSGYFIFCLFNPVIFKYQGAHLAGQFGFTWALLGSVATVANAWSSTKMPYYGVLISLGKREELNNLWFKNSLLSFVINFMGCCAVLVLAFICQHYYPKYGDRMLGIRIVCWLVVAALINNIVNSCAYYMRAHKVEMYMLLSIYTAIGVASLTLLLGYYGTVEAVTLGYMGVTLILFPYALMVFRDFRSNQPRTDGGMTGY